MTRLPRGVSGRRTIAALKRAGFSQRRGKGNHVVLRREDPFAQVVVPLHRSLDTGTLAAILDACNLSVEEFLRLLG